MPKDPQEFADLFGAKLVGEVPDIGAGPFGMARLAHLMHQRLAPSQGERPGRPTDAIWESRPKVPMSQATRRRLAEIAQAMSTAERQVSPMQVAAQLLEEAVSRVPLHETEDTPEEAPAALEVTNSSAGENTELHESPGVLENQTGPVRKKAKGLKTRQDQGARKLRHRQGKS